MAEIGGIFLRRPLTTIAILSLMTLAVDVTEHFGYLAQPVETGIKFACWLAASMVVLWQIRTNRLMRPYAGLVALTLVIGYGAIAGSWTNNFPVLNRVVAFGQASRVGQLTERTCSVAWATLPFLLFSLYIKNVDRMRSKLSRLGNKRARELSESNARLRQEIRERMCAANQRDQARLELEIALEGSTQRLADTEEVLARHERLSAISRISTGIAHELNNSLTPVVSYSNLLLKTADLPDEQKKWLQHLSASTHDALRVVRNLQQFSQDEKGAQFRMVSPTAIINQVVELTRPIWKNAPSPHGGHVLVHTSFLSDRNVNGNAAQLRQVVTNLLLNAIEAIEGDGNVTISVESEISVESDSQALCIHVTDDGQGMPPEEVARCFEPFFTTKEHGTGLGLSVCHGVIQNHGGVIDILTSPGKGTTFSIRLPTTAVEAPEIAATSDEPLTNQTLKDVRILLVEDNESVRVSVTDMLEIVGANVTAAASGADALNYLRLHRFDIVFTDLGLPEMDGSQVIARTREFCDTPIVLMSGWPNNRIMKCLQGKPQPDAIVSKPTQFGHLLEVIKRLTASDRLSLHND